MAAIEHARANATSAAEAYFHDKYKTLIIQARSEGHQDGREGMKELLHEIKNAASEALEKEKQKALEIEARAKDELARSRLDMTAAEERGRQAGLENKETALKDLEERLYVRPLDPNTNQCSPHHHQAKWSEDLRKAEQAKQQLVSELEESLKVERLNCQVRYSIQHSGVTFTEIAIPSVLVRNSGLPGRMLRDLPRPA